MKHTSRKKQPRFAVVEKQTMSDGSVGYNVVLYHDMEPLVRIGVSGAYRDVVGLAALLNDMGSWVEVIT